MIAAWVHNLDPFAVQFGSGFGIRWYGLAYLAAFAAAYFVYRHLAKRGFSVIPPDKVGDFITGCAVFGVLLGGRIGYMLFYDFSGFLRDPLVFFRVWEGGMANAWCVACGGLNHARLIDLHRVCHLHGLIGSYQRNRHHGPLGLWPI